MSDQAYKKRLAKTFLLVFYFSISAISIFLTLVILREVELQLVKYALLANLGALACASLVFKKPFAALVVVIIVFLVTPSFYFDPYIEIKNTAREDFRPLSEAGGKFKFYANNDSDLFLLVEKTHERVKCYGPYILSDTSCERLGRKLFEAAQ